MPDITGSTEVSLSNRPDIIKDLNYRSKLSAVELKGTFFKFLLQAGVPFTPKQRLGIPTTVNIDRMLKKHTKRGTYPSTRVYRNLNKITVACQLDGVYVDNLPVFVELRYKDYEEMGNRERNRLLSIQKKVKLITFFHDDFEKVGIKRDEEAAFIPPMGKRVLKRWANLLFEKIRKLEGEEITIPYSLLDLKDNIDTTASSEGNIVQTLKDKNSTLRKRIISEHIANNFSLQNTHDKILNELVSLNSESLAWVDKILYTVMENFLFTIDLRTRKFKDIFTQKQGSVNPMNKELLTNYIIDSINRKINNVYANLIEENIIEICNTKTLQNFILILNVTTAKEIRSISIPDSFGQAYNNDLVFTLTTYYDNISKYSKPREVAGGVILTSNSTRKNTYTKNYILNLFRSKREKDKYSDWAV